MAKAITLFKIFARQKYKPNEILYEMNNDLKMTNPKGTFITSIIGSYNLKTDEVINFSSVCKQNNLQFPSERFTDLINYLNVKDFEKVSDELQIMYHLLPTNKIEKDKLKDLISEYFGHVVKQESRDFITLDKYNEKNYFEKNADDLNTRFQNISKDILSNFGEIDFSRPVSNMYWLNQIKKSQFYENEISFFNISFALPSFLELISGNIGFDEEGLKLHLKGKL